MTRQASISTLWPPGPWRGGRVGAVSWKGREPNDGYRSNVWLVKPFSLASRGQRPAPEVMVFLGHGADPPWNDSHFKHERFNRLLVEARAELYFEMQQIMRDEKLSGNGSPDGSRGAERWWFA